MIGRLRGRLVARRPPRLLVDVGGIGYELDAPLSACERLPGEVGAEIELYTHLAIRDDAQALFGFSSERERDVFRVLIGVGGIGPKLGLQILSGMDVERFLRCVAEQDLGALTALPGVGKKTAGRLLVDLQDRLSAYQPTLPARADETPGAVPGAPAARDAEKALVALGYKPAVARRAIAALGDQARALGSEELVRAALRAMAR